MSGDKGRRDESLVLPLPFEPDDSLSEPPDELPDLETLAGE